LSERLISIPEAAQLLNVTRSALYAMVERGEVPHVRMGQRRIRFDLVDLRQWLESKRVPAEPPAGFSPDGRRP